MYYGGLVEGYLGEWLTRNHRFITYLIFQDDSDSQIEEVDEWKDITDEIEVNSHTKGKGNSYGQLCVNVLNKMNNNIKPGGII